ncbi:EamA family transporter [Rhodococcus sp. 06-418-5]|uniref:DMT family transporter n=1 Tax=Rhodococcus sp. 06-418-5 TaxID=2022507 RepID=UPI000B9B8888|nr:DMT family transporter [Rhodococcus sp. 06-418-5]OZC76905.1 EamA family transporter [Rhodococcus sp. 06-418-5]
MRSRVDVIAGTALVVLWSSGFIGAELGTAEAPAHTLLAWRYLAAAALLIAWCRFRKLTPTWHAIRIHAVLGLFCQFLYLGATITGIGMGVPPGVAALIAALQPLVVAMASSRIFGERVGGRQVLGLVVGIAGVSLVVVGDLSGADLFWPVYLLPAAGMLALSVGTIGQRVLAPKEPIALAMAIQCSISAVGFMTWSALAGDVAPPMTRGFLAAVVWTVVLSTFGAYGAYLFVVRRNGPTRASVLLYLTPPTTMLWALLMFGDEITWLGLGGLVVSAIGVAAYLRGTHVSDGSTGRSAGSTPADPATKCHSPASAASIASSSANATK